MSLNSFEDCSYYTKVENRIVRSTQVTRGCQDTTETKLSKSIIAIPPILFYKNVFVVCILNDFQKKDDLLYTVRK